MRATVVLSGIGGSHLVQAPNITSAALVPIDLCRPKPFSAASHAKAPECIGKLLVTHVMLAMQRHSKYMPDLVTAHAYHHPNC